VTDGRLAKAPAAAAERALRQAHHTLSIETRGSGFTDVTARVARWLREIGAGDGLLTLFIRHTSASLVIQENTDPDVLTDLAGILSELAPEARDWRHDCEGADDMPAHVKSMLTSTSLSIPVAAGAMMLGTWQALFVAEHRRRPHRREVVLHYLGTLARD